MSTAQAMQTQAEHQESLLAKSNVVGVGVGLKESNGVTTNEVAVVVLVEQKRPLAALESSDIIPKRIDGTLTDVIEVGFLRAQASPRERFRPVVPNGVSIGHYKVTAGTLGALVKDKTTGEPFLLSNNHVFANSNDAETGDPILQPGAMDGGMNPGDIVARLERFVPLMYIDDLGTPTPTQPPPTQPPPTQPPPQPSPTQPPTDATGCNLLGLLVALANLLASLSGSDKRAVVAPASVAQALSAPGAIASAPSPLGLTNALAAFNVQAAPPENRVDCALAKPLNPAMFSDEALSIGVVNETKPVTLGMRVRKSGRTTGYTEGSVKLLNATVNITYSTVKGPRIARFVGQVIADPMSQGGDSGSLIVDVAENKAVGLLFAGSELATIFTPLDAVLDALNVTL